jgi:hypothetical protein
MPALLDAFELHGELVSGKTRYSPKASGESLQMSAATIDRYLALARAKDPLRGKSTTKPSPQLRSSISIRMAGDRGLRGRHRVALRTHVEGRVRADVEAHVHAHQVGSHPLDAQQGTAVSAVP